MAKTTDHPAAKRKDQGIRSSRNPARLPRQASRSWPAPRQPGVERRKNHPLRAKHGHLSIILTQAVPHVGQPGDLVKVKPGFARNYLIPQGLATFATAHNLRIIEKHRKKLKELEQARRADLQNLAAQIAQRSLTIEANANEEGHLYGSVNADQIADALRKRVSRSRPRTSASRARSRTWASTRSRLCWARISSTEVKLWVVPTHTEEGAGA